jgi:hypothetical protein
LSSVSLMMSSIAQAMSAGVAPGGMRMTGGGSVQRSLARLRATSLMMRLAWAAIFGSGTVWPLSP